MLYDHEQIVNKYANSERGLITQLSWMNNIKFKVIRYIFL